jgi:hypothetical protein
MTTEINATPNKLNTLRQAYFYVIMVGCIIAFSIASVTILQNVLSRYIFPKASYDMGQYGYGYSMERSCQDDFSGVNYGKIQTEPVAIIPADKLKECVANKTQQEADRKESVFQSFTHS